MTITNASDNGGKTKEKISETHAETHSKKSDQMISGDELHEKQPSVSQKGFSQFENLNFSLTSNCFKILIFFIKVIRQ